MAKTDFKSVDEYIATHPEDVQAILQRVRSTIRKSRARRRGGDQLPDPRVQTGRWPPALFRWVEAALLALSATDHLIEAFKDDLAPYKVNKGTIRFPLSQPVPVKLIERIAKFRAKEAAERTRAKLAAPNKR
jgi:uncharacterized protein YdhG (YjbR/CyaY superfamily)